jgi:hypothetical protein
MIDYKYYQKILNQILINCNSDREKIVINGMRSLKFIVSKTINNDEIALIRNLFEILF